MNSTTHSYPTQSKLPWFIGGFSCLVVVLAIFFGHLTMQGYYYASLNEQLQSEINAKTDASTLLSNKKLAPLISNGTLKTKQLVQFLAHLREGDFSRTLRWLQFESSPFLPKRSLYIEKISALNEHTKKKDIANSAITTRARAIEHDVEVLLIDSTRPTLSPIIISSYNTIRSATGENLPELLTRIN